MTAPVRVSVRAFAAAREVLGSDALVLEVPPGTTVAGLRALLGERAPALLRLPLAFAVDRAYAAPERVLRGGEEVALIPPISGGGDDDRRDGFAFTTGAIDVRALERACRTDHDGAVVAFTGTTRDHADGQAVQSLAYEAYAEMAAPLVEALFARAFAQFAITRARIVHRLGEVPIGEAAVAVVVSAAHRGPAFEACRFLMDRLKVEVPIFKRERLAGDGGARWVGDLPRPDPPAT